MEKNDHRDIWVFLEELEAETEASRCRAFGAGTPTRG